MLSDRQKRLIQYLEKRKAFTKGSDLGLLFGVSERTIRSDIDAINRTKLFQIVGTLQGYSLETQQKVNDGIKGEEVPQSSKERQRTILFRLLHGEKRLNLTNLMNDFYVSESSVEQDLLRIREYLEQFELKITRKDNCIYLEGSEQKKRHLFKLMLLKESNSGLIEIDWLNKMFDGYDVYDIMDKFEELSKKYNYTLHGVAYQMLVIHMVIALERIKKGYYMQKVEENPYEGRIEYELTLDFYAYIKSLLQCEIPEQEVLSFTRLLVGNRYHTSTKEVKNFELSDVCNRAIEELSNYFNIDLTSDKELIVGLSIHIEYMLYRMEHNIEIQNALLYEIKHSMPLVFELSIHLGNILSRELGIKIGDSEIGFLSLHLGSTLNRSSYNKRLRVVIVNPFTNRTTQSLEAKLSIQFQEDIEIVGSMPYINQNKIKYYHPDFIVSTIKLNEIDSYVQVKPDVDHKDYVKITEYVKLLDQKKSVRTLLQDSEPVFDSSLFFTQVAVDSREDIIQFLCHKLIEVGAVRDDFYDNVMKREALSSTSFEQFFAVPHSMQLDAKKTKVAVAILDKPLVWGEYLVKIVLLFAISEKDRGQLGTLYQLISNALTESDVFEQVIKCKNYKQFLAVIEQTKHQ